MTAKFSCDVLVIGAGGAGMRAAIAAGEAGSKVIVACKSLLGKAHTVMAEGGIAAGLGNVDNPDNWETHFADTIRGGKYLNNWRMVEIYAHEVIDRVYELEQWGGLFDRTADGLISQRPFGGHTYRRLCHVGDRTGLELIRTLQDKMVHTEGVEVLMEYTMIKLLKNGDRVVGAFGYSRNDGEAVVIKAKAVIMATGGWGKMYQTTSNSWESTGDGASLAYEAGADLLDMEFVQFHPTGMVWPPGARGILVTEAVRGEGGILLNNKGERFMEQYDPKKMELSTRDVVARSIYKEVQAGRGSEHGGALLDIHHKGANYILKKLPSMHEQFWSLASVDITKEPMEVYPTIHYTMGGVKVEPETAATTIAGLYAAGESAGGLHGGNRLGGNSLGDILVFGKRSGEAAAEFAKAAQLAEVDDTQVRESEAWLEAPLKRSDGENPFKLHAELQAAMQDDAGISRTEESLQRSLDKVLELKKRTENLAVAGNRKLNPGWHACFDMQSMLTVSEAIVRAAMARKESRASHWRLDFPDLSEEEGKKNYLVRKDGAGMKVESMAHDPMPERLAVLVEEK